MNIKEVIEKYQCPGCIIDKKSECFEKGVGLECKNHVFVMYTSNLAL